jgi:hypothetical protein
MLTNLDLIWIYVKSLAEKLMSSDENMLDEELYSQYCTGFEQLVQIIEEPDTQISEEKYADMKHTLGALERRFAEYQARIQESITQNRLKSKVVNLYAAQTAGLPSGTFSKKS